MRAKFGLTILVVGVLGHSTLAAPSRPTACRPPAWVVTTDNPRTVKADERGLDQTDELIYFENFESGASGWLMIDLTASTTWHPDAFNACGGSGMSWWSGDANLDGYDDYQLQYLDSPTLDMSMATNPILQFNVFWAVEELTGGYPPGYDGWDGANVWVSTDDGNSWSALPVQIPAYSCTSLGSFGYTWGFGTGIPGWGGFSGGQTPGVWLQAIANMTGYTTSAVKIRFGFASDEEWCTRNQADLTGFFVDNINLHEGATTYLLNDGEGTAIPGELTPVSGMGSVGNFWHVEAVPNPPPPSGLYVMTLSNAQGSYDPMLNNALISPRIDLSGLSADSVKVLADFYVRGSINVGDPDGWPNLDFWTVQVSPDGGLNWYYYSNPWNGNDPNLVWVGLPLNYTPFSALNGYMIDLSPYIGYDVRFRFLFRSDADSYAGEGLFMDNLSVETRLISDHDAAARNLWVPMPTSTYFSSLNGSVEVHNEGNQAESAIPIYWRIDEGIPTAIMPFPSVPAGGSVVQPFVWGNPTEGTYLVTAFTTLAGDTIQSNDTTTAGLVVITPAELLEFGYDNRQYSYLSTYSGFEFLEGTGPCVRFTPQDDGATDLLNAIQIKALFQSTGAVRVHVFAAGSTTEPGAEVAQFDADVTVVDPQWQTFSLSGVPYLQNASTDFWIQLEIVDAGNQPNLTGAPSVHPDGHFFYSTGTAYTPSAYDYFLRVEAEPLNGVEDPWRSELPAQFRLGQNHPNPFNPMTIISYALPHTGNVTLAVYDLSGRLVATLVDGLREAGNHEVTFDGSNLASGVYLYRLQADDFRAVGKMVLMK